MQKSRDFRKMCATQTGNYELKLWEWPSMCIRNLF